MILIDETHELALRSSMRILAGLGRVNPPSLAGPALAGLARCGSGVEGLQARFLELLILREIAGCA